MVNGESSRLCTIFHAKYEKVNQVKTMTKYYQHLMVPKHQSILYVLIEYECLFGGIIGTWHTSSVYYELRNDTQSIC